MDYREFYKSKGISLDRVRHIGITKFGIPGGLVDVGAQKVYRNVKGGERVKDIALVHRIFAEAKPLVKDNNEFNYHQTVNQIAALRRRVELLERPWSAKFKSNHGWLFTDITWSLMKSLWAKFKVKYWWLFVERKLWQ